MYLLSKFLVLSPDLVIIDILFLYSSVKIPEPYNAFEMINTTLFSGEVSISVRRVLNVADAVREGDIRLKVPAFSDLVQIMTMPNFLLHNSKYLNLLAIALS